MSEKAAILANDRIKLGCGYWVGLMMKLGFNTQEPHLYIQKKGLLSAVGFRGWKTCEKIRLNAYK